MVCWFAKEFLNEKPMLFGGAMEAEVEATLALRPHHPHNAQIRNNTKTHVKQFKPECDDILEMLN